MARKLRSMFKPLIPQPGSGERPVSPAVGAVGLGGAPAGSVVESDAPIGAPESKGGVDRDLVAKLAYERWLETGAGAVENWVWAEAEAMRRIEGANGAD
jgi:hypothetical protein